LTPSKIHMWHFAPFLEKTLMEKRICTSPTPSLSTWNLAYLFFQRIDPFNVMIKNYEEKQKAMMEKQVERCKKEMDYLQQKLKENLLHEDTRAMVRFMKEDNDAKEKELVALKMKHKRLTLQHTLLASDHEMLKMKYSDTSENAPSSYEQYQRQIDDWHNKLNARDADVKLLTRQVENLKNVIMTQGLAMPPPEPVSAPAPTPVGTVAVRVLQGTVGTVGTAGYCGYCGYCRCVLQGTTGCTES
jgi:hypothetical protein